MDFISSLIVSEKEFYITIIVVVLVLLSYFLVPVFKRVKAISNKIGNIKTILFTRMLGFFLFGIIPVLSVFFFSENILSSYGVQISNINKSLLWIIPLSPVLITVTYFNSKQKEHLSVYPQIRKANWTSKLLALSMSTWVLYLLAYEFLFRGYLLLVSITFLGIWPAVILNIIIYSLAHIPKGTKETVMAIPFGLVIALSVIHTGNILVAVILHSILALSTEWFSLKAHPEMKFVKE